MRHSLKLLFRGVLILVASCISWAEATASPRLTFQSSDPSSAQVSWAGGTSPLVTTHAVPIDSVSGVDTPTGTSPQSIAGGALTFTTGGWQAYTTDGSRKDWYFAGGGQIELVGGISTLGIEPGSVLLTGSFDSDSVIVFGYPASSGSTAYVVGGSAAFTDTKSPALLAHFGLPTGSSLGGGFTFSAVLVPLSGTVDDAFQSTAFISFSLFNVATSVPAPATLALLGIGLAGLGVARRRKAQ